MWSSAQSQSCMKLEKKDSELLRREAVARPALARKLAGLPVSDLETLKRNIMEFNNMMASSQGKGDAMEIGRVEQTEGAQVQS